MSNRLIVASLLFVVISTSSYAQNVGFDQVQIPLPNGDLADGAFWYPSSSPAVRVPVDFSEQRVSIGGSIAGQKLPFVVLSHGALGSWKSNLDTAVALAQAGFVSAALTYDKPAHDGVLRVAQHGQRLSALIDFALHDWRYHTAIDANEVGAFGFSLGAFTVLTVIGGRPDLSRIARHCLAVPLEWSCVVRSGHHLDIAFDPPPNVDWIADPRIKAAVIAAPALGYLFGKEGLATVHVPVQLWQASDDRTLTEPWNAEAIKRDLPQGLEFHLVAGADHADFGVPCTLTLARAAPDFCEDSWGFDRDGFHRIFNKQIIQFFGRMLKGP